MNEKKIGLGSGFVRSVISCSLFYSIFVYISVRGARCMGVCVCVCELYR